MDIALHPRPPGFQPCDHFAVTVDGEALDCFQMEVASLGTWSCDRPVEVVVRLPAGATEVDLQPHPSAPAHSIVDGDLRFSLDAPRPLSITCPGHPPLYLFASPAETDVPDRDDPSVIFVGPGEELSPDILQVPSGHTLYIAGGAVVRAPVRVSEAENVRICGRGVVDGSTRRDDRYRQIVIEGSRDVVLEGVISLDPPQWNIVIGNSDNVVIDGTKEIGVICCSDGIDIVGSRNVTVRNAFIRANDDCVAIKAVSYHDRHGGPYVNSVDWRNDVADVVVEHCVMYNDEAGNVLEIGFETQCDRMSGLVFRDIDVIGAHGKGGVFTIHAGDRALIEDVRYEDIRIEHFYDQLIDFRIMSSRYSRDDTRGRVRNIHLKQVRGIEDRYNCISLFGGFDDDHLVSDIHLEDVVLGERHLMNLNDLHGFTRCAEGIRFS